MRTKPRETLSILCETWSSIAKSCASVVDAPSSVTPRKLLPVAEMSAPMFVVPATIAVVDAQKALPPSV